MLFFLSSPVALLCGTDPSKETYNGEPVYTVIGHGVTAPRATYDPEPEYDDQSSKDKVEGTVLLSVIVTKEGRTAGMKVKRSLTPALDKQAIKAVSEWRFDPATKDGAPVAVRLIIEIEFRLR
jgi:periplasmic protein TonB